MAALLPKGPRFKRHRTELIDNYYVDSQGRRYRVCANRGRVLFVMLKHKHAETALEPAGNRFVQIVELAVKEHGVQLRYRDGDDVVEMRPGIE